MKTTTEQFWCPSHGRLHIDLGKVHIFDEQGRGPYIPYYQVRCQLCGRRGHFVCRGDTPHCRLHTYRGPGYETTVDNEVCLFHRCFTADIPFPGGVEYVTATLQELDEALRNPFSDVGMSMNPQ